MPRVWYSSFFQAFIEQYLQNFLPNVSSYFQHFSGDSVLPWIFPVLFFQCCTYLLLCYIQMIFDSAAAAFEAFGLIVVEVQRRRRLSGYDRQYTCCLILIYPVGLFIWSFCGFPWTFAIFRYKNSKFRCWWLCKKITIKITKKKRKEK